MSIALIGHSGFVGSNLLAQRPYDALFRSSDIHEIRGKSFDHVVCAGVQAMKWWANLHPGEDRAGIDKLLEPLSEVRAKRFTLISTIDVYPAPRGVDEDSTIERQGHHTYGLHRLEVEDWIRERFPESRILRLPGLFGPGIKKNVIYDLLHDNGLDKVHPGGVFQYYDLKYLTRDIDRAWDLGLGLLNLSCEPLATAEIRDRYFPGKELGASGPPPAGYDMRSKHAAAWEGEHGYLYSKARVMDDLGMWIDEEKSKAES
ncbi:MAG: NAD(P)-dependent oxidoreductase [Verrucomicrobiota bacterium]